MHFNLIYRDLKIPMLKNLLIALSAALLIPACASNHALVAADGSKSERFKGLVYVREYVDMNKVNGKDEYARVRLSWDYDKGMTIVETFDMNHNPISTKEEPGLTPNATEQETARAIALVKAEPKLKSVVNQPGLFFHSGFIYRDGRDKFCGAFSRCVHVFVSGGDDSGVPLGHAIVDLMRDSVVHPFFAPEEIPGKKITHSK